MALFLFVFHSTLGARAVGRISPAHERNDGVRNRSRETGASRAHKRLPSASDARSARIDAEERGSRGKEGTRQSPGRGARRNARP